MKVQLKKWLRSFLSLKKSEQRGIIILIVIILIINSFNVIVPYIFKPKIDPKFAQNKNITKYVYFPISLFPKTFSKKLPNK